MNAVVNMTDARKTMALALDALHAMVNAMLDRGVHTDPEHPYRQALNFACTARNALRTALEQQAEPVAWDKPSTSFNDWWNGDYDDAANPFEKDSAAYWLWAGWQAAQRQWVGLTDEDFCDQDHEWIAGASWAEAKLKRKNT